MKRAARSSTEAARARCAFAARTSRAATSCGPTWPRTRTWTPSIPARTARGYGLVTRATSTKMASSC
eukprot:6295476-Prymnesium_polylepis.1